MGPYEKIYNELSQRLSDEEIADGYLIPADLSAEESAVAEAELRAYRLERLSNRTESDRVLSDLTRLRLELHRYIEADVYSSDYDFGKILAEMITILRKSKREVADDLDVHYTRLSRIINHREDPNLSLMYRLEKYTRQVIPALYWWKLLIRKQAFLIQQDKVQRLLEGERVKNVVG
jgi:hypothetical protein